MTTITTVDSNAFHTFRPPFKLRVQVGLLRIWHTVARRHRATCNHDTYLKDILPRFPECGIVTLPRNDEGIRLCHQCLQNGAIRCAWCNHPILFGDQITLYNVAGSNPLPHAVKPRGRPGTTIGCMGCADDISGTWIPHGIRHISGEMITV